MMPRTYRVIVTPQALADIDAIIRHVKADSPQNAALVLDRLWEAAQSLREFPRRSKVHRSGRRTG